MNFRGRVDRDVADDLLLLRELVLADERRGNPRVVVEVQVLADELVLVPGYRLVEVLVCVELVDEGLLGSEYRQQNVLHRNLEVSGVDVLEVLLEALKLHQVFLLR